MAARIKWGDQGWQCAEPGALKKSGLILFPDHANFFMMSSFMNELSKPQPVPGGGGAAAQGALNALALLTKVIALETIREGLSPDQKEAWRLLDQRARDLRQGLLRLRRRDGQAYLRWVRHRGSVAEGEYARVMAEVPGQIIERSGEVLELIPQVGVMSRNHLRPDLLAAAELLRGAGLAAARIALANLSQIRDGRVRKRLAGDLKNRSITMLGQAQKALKPLPAERYRP